MLRFSAGVNSGIRIALILGTLVVAGAFLEQALPADGPDNAPKAATQDTGVYTTAHPTVFDAVKEFFNSRPTAIQPIAFTHKVHLAQGLQCVNCHTGVDEGPDARIPSVSFCMTCHQVIAKDKPEIKKVAAYRARGEDIPWQRVYGFEPSAHVKFNHAPHIRAGVQCAACHGDMTKQTVAERKVNLTMGYCIDCHQQKKVSVDCVTCHF
ncbi:MAG TPA: cytochrome c3 family protein [Verrucomicrobiae bacterium]|nr:cytochrome c3 family protein [Verrucomicrobiae bacterium]